MAATPGQPPPGSVSIGPQPSVVCPPSSSIVPQPSPPVASSVSLPSSVQRIDIPVGPVNMTAGPAVVRVSQPQQQQIGQPAVGIQSMVSRPQGPTSSAPANTTPFLGGLGQLQNLGLIVSRMPDAKNQIVFQQGTAPGRPVVVTSSAGGQIFQQSIPNRAPIRAQFVQHALPAGTVTIPGHGHIGRGPISVMNLSVPSNVSQSGVVGPTGKQQPATAFISRTFTGNYGDGQTVNFILSDSKTPIRLSSDMIKNATMTGAGGKQIPARFGVQSVGVAGVSSGQKILNLGSAVSVSAPMSGQVGGQPVHHPTQVTRLNIIQGPGGQHPMVVNTSVPAGHGKQGGVINIAPVQKQQPQTVILNPATNQMIAASGPGLAKLNQQGVKTTLVAMNQGMGHQQQHLNSTVINASALRGIATGPGGVGIGVPGGTIVSHTVVSQHSQQQLHQPVVAITSPIKNSTNCIGGVHVQATSPIKSQNSHNPTPSSPARPSILARKRNLDGNSQPMSSQGSVGRSPMKPGLAEGLAAKVEAELTAEGGVVPLSVASQSVHGSHIQQQQFQPSLSQGSTSTQSAESGTISTPRKKPRKQVLESTSNLSTSANMKLIMGGSGDEQLHHQQQPQLRETNQKRTKDVLDETEAMNQIPRVNIEPVDPLIKKFRPALYTSVIPPWKSLQHHFLRYSDVKPRPEKRMTLSELSNEGLQKKNGWKIHHLATQMIDMGEDESVVLERIEKLLKVLEEKKEAPSQGTLNGSSSSNNGSQSSPFVLETPEKVIDLVRGNLQRSKIFREQMDESQKLLIKLTNDHREKVAKLTRKNMHKRTCIAK